MNRVLLVVVMLMMTSSAHAVVSRSVSVADLTWDEMIARGDFTADQFVTLRPGVEMLKVTNTTDRELRYEVFSHYTRKITGPNYAIRGEVVYNGVQGHAYLEMRSYFPPPNTGPFFSRTLRQHGLTGWITGTGHRGFEVPFFLRKGDPKPTRLAFYVVLPAHGTIYLGQPALVEGYVDSPREENKHFRAAVRGQWWGERTGGLIGAIFGVVFGTLGAVIGTLSSRGRSRAFVLAAIRAQILLGAVLVVAGVAAIIAHQPYGVYYPLLLCGVILLFVWISTARGVKRRYHELELRRISAQDAGG